MTEIPQQPQRSIDLNADIGESFGAWAMGDDDGVIAQVSSASIACGFHAGDADTMHRTVARAAAAAVAIGAHVSLPDLQGFGRREMQISDDQAYNLVLYQIGALAAFTRAAGVALAHVKPHGALYNMAARDRALAHAVARAVRDFDATLVLFGLADSEATRAGERLGLAVAHEAFVDRSYGSDGRLTPRNEAGAMIETVDAAIAQALALARGAPIASIDGATIRIRADSLCIHGDRANAAEFARRVRDALDADGKRVAAPAANRRT